MTDGPKRGKNSGSARKLAASKKNYVEQAQISQHGKIADHPEFLLYQRLDQVAWVEGKISRGENIPDYEPSWCESIKREAMRKLLDAISTNDNRFFERLGEIASASKSKKARKVPAKDGFYTIQIGVDEIAKHVLFAKGQLEQDGEEVTVASVRKRIEKMFPYADTYDNRTIRGVLNEFGWPGTGLKES